MVEGVVVKLDGANLALAPAASASSTGSLFHAQLIVEPKLEIGHATEKRAHEDLALHVRTKHRALGGKEQVDILNDVQEHLILLVENPLLTPRDGAGHLQRGAGLRRRVDLLAEYAILQLLAKPAIA